MNITYSKTAQYLKPFMDAIKDLLPKTGDLSIKFYCVRKPSAVGCTTKRGRYYTITILKSDWIEDKEKYRPRTLEDVLVVLAHEVAHLKVWPHDYKHYALMSRVLIRWSRVVKRLDLNLQRRHVKV